jgi:hypothetical protein
MLGALSLPRDEKQFSRTSQDVAFRDGHPENLAKVPSEMSNNAVRKTARGLFVEHCLEFISG